MATPDGRIRLHRAFPTPADGITLTDDFPVTEVRIDGMTVKVKRTGKGTANIKVTGATVINARSPGDCEIVRVK